MDLALSPAEDSSTPTGDHATHRSIGYRKWFCALSLTGWQWVEDPLVNANWFWREVAPHE